MSTGIHIRRSACLLLAALLPQTAGALSLQEAERLALQNDPTVAGHLASASAHESQAVAADTLPDPQFRLGLFNVPLDDFDIDREPTTQLRLGVQQMFPRGDSTVIRSAHDRLQGTAARERAANAKRELLRDLRETFLDLYYETGAARIIEDSRKLFASLVKITEDRYGAGRANQQDVISASLELSRLDDRYTKILAMQDQHRAVLAQWLGDTALNTLDSEFPDLPPLPQFEDVNASLTQHPLILAEQAGLAAAMKMTDMARQDYSPGINAFVEYRKRFGENPDGSDRADMMAAMVTMDIPLFTANRQDRSVAAGEDRVAAARYRLDDRLRRLKQVFDSNRAKYRRALQREQLYRDSLIAAARENSSAALNAYQSGVTEFTTLMRAGITELDVRLDELRVRVDKAIAQAHLLYVSGE